MHKHRVRRKYLFILSDELKAIEALMFDFSLNRFIHLSLPLELEI